MRALLLLFTASLLTIGCRRQNIDTRDFFVLVEQQTPIEESTNLLVGPHLPLTYDAVGVQDRERFDPIMFLGGPLPRGGSESPFTLNRTAGAAPEFKVYRGKQDDAEKNKPLGVFQIIDFPADAAINRRANRLSAFGKARTLRLCA
jgi:hypothetical protein